jgi:F-type H+-transporting ATPase subunit gamma
MANRRAIVKRRKAVRNIKKITRTMQLIATARFQAAVNRATVSRPYVDKLAEMVADLARVTGELSHPLMESHGGEGRSALVVVTSNRGLCGGYNVNVVRAALDHLAQEEAAGVAAEVRMVGKKGISAFRFRRREMAARITDIDDKPRYEQVEPLARSLIEGFLAGRYATVHVAYMRFYTVGRQRPEVIRLLPLAREVAAEAGADAESGESERRGLVPQYEILPSPEALLDRLLPASVRMRLYQSFLDAAVSEQIARMTAMKAATEAADDMIGRLTSQYNRARQTQITMELLDIVGGANALA